MTGFVRRRLRRGVLAACCLFLAGVFAPGLTAVAAERSLPIGDSLVPAGTISFKLHTEESWQNGAGEKQEAFTFLRVPDLGQIDLRKTSTSVRFGWRWRGVPGAPGFQPQIPELPGPADYFFQITWDARSGRFDLYVNGMPMRDPRLPFEPWQFEKTPREMIVEDGPFEISRLKAQPQFLAPDAAREAVPADLLDHRADVFGLGQKPPAIATEGRLGNVVVDAALGQRDDVDGWVMEGPGKVEFNDGWMRMWSTRPDAGRGENGHVVFWCPRDIPAGFVAEWDVQILEDLGLTIFFFAAKGAGGEDVFDPSLPERDGTFTHYIRGAVNSYHTSYYASTPNFPGRASANLRKNNKFYLIASGPVAIEAGDKKIHRMRLVKDGPHVQLQTDGKVVIDYTDPGTDRYGPVYGGGKTAFRQMQWTVARYRNFRVTELLPK